MTFIGSIGLLANGPTRLNNQASANISAMTNASAAAICRRPVLGETLFVCATAFKGAKQNNPSKDMYLLLELRCAVVLDFIIYLICEYVLLA